MILLFIMMGLVVTLVASNQNKPVIKSQLEVEFDKMEKDNPFLKGL